MKAEQEIDMAKKETAEEDFVPCWMYGPNGEAKICNCKEDIPKGWKDHPRYFVKEEAGEPEALDL